jgi:serine protease Do
VRPRQRKDERAFRIVVLEIFLFLFVFVVDLRMTSLHDGKIGIHTNRKAHAEESPPVVAGGLPDFTSLVRKLGPAVVNIATAQDVEAPRFQSPFGPDDPFNEFWERFFERQFRRYGSPRGSWHRRSLGSGFIVDPVGLILTNYHVVKNATKVIVRLSDRHEFEAEIVGTDQKTDIAMIKIDAGKSLPTLQFGNSASIEVGEWTIAIGNPFGLDHTVTAGIVSAKGRRIGAGPYDDFIQTDASINPGNSGGPLINLRGEVIGINTAILSRSGANIGIGFAIPINLVKEVLLPLKEKGRVARGWLGISIQRVTPAIAGSLGLEKAEGALVASVQEDGPANKAGMEVGDVIVEFAGQPVTESYQLPRMVASTPIGKDVEVDVLRGGKELTLYVMVGELKDDADVASVPAVPADPNLGLSVQQVTPPIAASLGLESANGVIVTSVKRDSPADEAGLRRGDVIREIDRRQIKNLSDYQAAIKEVEKGDAVLLLVQRGTGAFFVAFRVPV